MIASTNTLFYCKSCKGSSVEELGDAMLCAACLQVTKTRENQPASGDKAGKTGDPQDPISASKAPSRMNFDEASEYCSTHLKHCFSPEANGILSSCARAIDPTATCSVCFRGGAQHTCNFCTMDCHNSVRGCSVIVEDGGCICTACNGIINLLPFYTILVFILSLVCS